MELETIKDRDFEKTLKEYDKVIVKYYADWCGSCKLFAPKFRRLSTKEAFEDVKFIKVNAEQNELARKKAGVDNLPYFAVFKNGKLLEGSATSKEDVVVGLINKLKSDDACEVNVGE